jgi:hypothetical protein
MIYADFCNLCEASGTLSLRLTQAGVKSLLIDPYALTLLEHFN